MGGSKGCWHCLSQSEAEERISNTAVWKCFPYPEEQGVRAQPIPALCQSCHCFMCRWGHSSVRGRQGPRSHVDSECGTRGAPGGSVPGVGCSVLQETPNSFEAFWGICPHPQTGTQALSGLKALAAAAERSAENGLGDQTERPDGSSSSVIYLIPSEMTVFPALVV